MPPRPLICVDDHGAIWAARSREERTLVVVQRQPADGVEVTGHAGRDLRGRGHPAHHVWRRLQAGTLRERPAARQRGIRDGNDSDGIHPGRLRGVQVVDAGESRGGREAGELDRAIAGAQDVGRGESQVVQPTAAGSLESGGHLAGNARAPPRAGRPARAGG